MSSATLIDLIANYAKAQKWAHERVDADHVILGAKGIWNEYQVHFLNQSSRYTQIGVSFGISYTSATLPQVLELLNEVNQELCGKSMVYLKESGTLMMRYLAYFENEVPSDETLLAAIKSSCNICEHYHPAFSSVAQGATAARAMQMLAMPTTKKVS